MFEIWKLESGKSKVKPSPSFEYFCRKIEPVLAEFVAEQHYLKRNFAKLIRVHVVKVLSCP